MKNNRKLILLFVALSVFISSFQCSAAGDDDPRTALRSTDVFTPYSENMFFSRYTPWIKSMALVSQAEKQANIIGGDGDQQIRCLDISSADNNIVVMGSDTSGVWLSENGGEFWYNVSANIDRTEIADVLCHPINKNIILAYSYSPKEGLSTPGILRTENLGKSWELVYADYINSSQIDELFAYDNFGNIYAVTGKGVIKSTDTGKTWELLLASTDENSDISRGRAVSIDVTPDGNIITACYSGNSASLSGINVSTDGGKTWSKKYIYTDTSFSVYSCDIDPKNNERLIASAYIQEDSCSYLYVSDNFGDTWTKFKTSESEYTMLQTRKHISRVKFSEDYLYISFYWLSQSFRRLPVREISNASKTKSWESIDLKTPGETGFLAGENMYIPQGFDIEGDLVFACSTGPIKSTDGGNTWVRKSSGYNGALATHIHMDKDGKMLLSLTDGNVAVSDSNYTKENIPTFSRKGKWGTSLSTAAIFDPNDENHLICWNGIANGSKNDTGIIISYDGGKTYKNADGTSAYDSLKEEYTNRVTDPCKMQPEVLEYDADNENIVYTSCATSTDNGETWTQNPYFLLDICDEAPDKMVSWDIYGTNPSYYLMYSEDRGKTWTKLVEAGTKKEDETAAFFDAENSGKLWYKQQYAFGTVDISSKIKNVYTSKANYKAFGMLVQNPKAPNHLLLSCEELKGQNCPSLYESLDYGESWHVVPGIFGMRTVRYLKFSTTTDEVFIGSHNGMIVYEYSKFNYYIGTILNYGEEIKYTTLEITDNYVLSPKEAFSVWNMSFRGWIYKGKTYSSGEKIYIKE